MDINNKDDKQYLEKEILAPSTHLAEVNGVILIGRITWSFNYWFKVPDDLLRKVTDAWVKLINGVVLIDDIQDNSLVRRGKPTAHLVYGVPLTINSAVQVMAESMKIALELAPDPSRVKGFADQFHDMWKGQGTEVYWKHNFICPTEDQYTKMTHLKTATVILVGVRLLQVVSDHDKNYDDLARLLGHYSQLRDDYCNLRAKELNSNGSFCEDISEGKFSLPIIHASKTSVGNEVLRILRQRTRDIDLKKYCMSLLEKAGSIQYTRNRLSELDREARAEVARLGGNPLLEKCLDDLSSWKDDVM
ncbi:geranylgeranyl pyrophosphate synthase like protein, partial [Danaus plexippus plexippus]